MINCFLVKVRLKARFYFRLGGREGGRGGEAKKEGDIERMGRLEANKEVVSDLIYSDKITQEHNQPIYLPLSPPVQLIEHKERNTNVTMNK